MLDITCSSSPIFSKSLLEIFGNVDHNFFEFHNVIWRAEYMNFPSGRETGKTIEIKRRRGQEREGGNGD